MNRLQPRPDKPFAQPWNHWVDEQHTVSVMFETWEYYLDTSVSQFPHHRSRPPHLTDGARLARDDFPQSECGVLSSGEEHLQRLRAYLLGL